MSSIPRGDIEADSSISYTREAGTWTVRGSGQDDVLGLDACKLLEHRVLEIRRMLDGRLAFDRDFANFETN
jgi:hypothetical protein